MCNKKIFNKMIDFISVSGIFLYFDKNFEHQTIYKYLYFDIMGA